MPYGAMEGKAPGSRVSGHTTMLDLTALGVLAMRGATDFRSTAGFYSRHRVPYPVSLIAGLKADAGIGPDSAVLDLATGPGRLALAPFVREVVAVDAEPEMIDEGSAWLHAKASAMSGGFTRGRSDSTSDRTPWTW